MCLFAAIAVKPTRASQYLLSPQSESSPATTAQEPASVVDLSDSEVPNGALCKHS